MAKMTVDELRDSLVSQSYTPRTQEELQAAAEKRYQTQYNQQRLTAQQNYDTKDLAYQQQLANLSDTLAQNQQEVVKNTEDSIRQANRYLITRGMQRSSYGLANQGNLMNKGNNSLALLLKQYGTDANAIEGNRTLLAQQLADTLAQYDIDYLNDIQGYMDEQEQKDYDRKVAADAAQNQLQMQLFEYSQKYGSSGGGGGRRRGGGTGTASTTDALTNYTNGESPLFTALGGGASRSNDLSSYVNRLSGRNINTRGGGGGKNLIAIR